MKNDLHKKCWNSGTNTAHVEPPPIILIKETYNGKSDKDFVKLKLCRDHKSSTMDLYEFNMYFLTKASQKSFCCLYATST